MHGVQRSTVVSHRLYSGVHFVSTYSSGGFLSRPHEGLADELIEFLAIRTRNAAGGRELYTAPTMIWSGICSLIGAHAGCRPGQHTRNVSLRQIGSLIPPTLLHRRLPL